MADTAAHLVDRVLPRVPIRQWVLSLPFAPPLPARIRRMSRPRRCGDALDLNVHFRSLVLDGVYGGP
jgi:hypothetical protein